MNLFHTAAEKDNTSAMSELARWYELTNDAEEAKKWHAKFEAEELVLELRRS